MEQNMDLTLIKAIDSQFKLLRALPESCSHVYNPVTKMIAYRPIELMCLVLCTYLIWG